jgi:hypothetical protein
MGAGHKTAARKNRLNSTLKKRGLGDTQPGHVDRGAFKNLIESHPFPLEKQLQ